MESTFVGSWGLTSPGRPLEFSLIGQKASHMIAIGSTKDHVAPHTKPTSTSTERPPSTLRDKLRVTRAYGLIGLYCRTAKLSREKDVILAAVAFRLLHCTSSRPTAHRAYRKIKKGHVKSVFQCIVQKHQTPEGEDAISYNLASCI